MYDCLKSFSASFFLISLIVSRRIIIIFFVWCTYTNYFMIPHNLPRTIEYKCYDHDGEHHTKHYEDDIHLLVFTCFILMIRMRKLSCYERLTRCSTNWWNLNMLTLQFSSASSHRKRQFTSSLHFSSFFMQVWSSQSYSSSRQGSSSQCNHVFNSQSNFRIDSGGVKRDREEKCIIKNVRKNFED